MPRFVILGIRCEGTAFSYGPSVLILPMIWLRTGERPAAGAWLGAALVVAGMALLFVR